MAAKQNKHLAQNIVYLTILKNEMKLCFNIVELYESSHHRVLSILMFIEH